MSRLTFLGAVGEVTGSRYLLEIDDHAVLLECGLRQGGPEAERRNEEPLGELAQQVDAVVLSHAHLDHSGLLPRLVRAGYRGPIHCTSGTVDLLEILLRDAAFIMQKDLEWENRHRERAGRTLIEPLYDLDDVATTLQLCEPLGYGQPRTLVPGATAILRDAGHILGSAIVELNLEVSGRRQRLVFSGDLGNPASVLMHSPQRVENADVVLLESTYGDRDHRPLEETLEEFADLLAEAQDDGGNVLIPAFAVGRTQELLYHLAVLHQQGRVPQQRIFLDAPMGIEVCELYARSYRQLNQADLAALNTRALTDFADSLPPLRVTRTVEESMQINRLRGGAIIIAGSGMCEGGRILHHLRHNVSQRSCHVVIVGFQAGGTRGRRLVDGADSIRLHGEDTPVRAHIHTLGGLSAHAGQSDLISWASVFHDRPVFHLVHGEPEKQAVLRDALRDRLGADARIPAFGEVVEL